VKLFTVRKLYVIESYIYIVGRNEAGSRKATTMSGIIERKAN